MFAQAPQREPRPQAVSPDRSATARTTPPATVELDNCSLTYATTGKPAIQEITFAAREAEFISIVGPSGCGKSTILGLISGLLSPTSGSVRVLGQQVTGINRSVGFILQRDALLPWRTALQNVALPLTFRGVGMREAREKAREWLSRVGLSGDESSYPHQLSGGMRKRVSIAATLCYEPKVLLMDEPFSALDAQTRLLMEADLLDLWQGSAQTVIFVTHDLEEAVSMSDRILLISSAPGRLTIDRDVALPRPRDLLEVKFDQQFVSIHHEIWTHLRDEVLASQGTTWKRGSSNGSR